MNIKTIVWFLVGMVGVLGLVVLLLWQFGSNTGKPILDIAGEKVHMKGSGAIEIVEFSDFQCPACASVQPELKELLEKYQDKVRFVYRHLPLSSIHPYAMAAASAAEAAGKQGKFFEMHDVLFARQGEWSKQEPKEKFLEYAKEIGLDQAKFLSDMESREVKEAIEKDVLAATKNRVLATPTFFVNSVVTDFGEIETKILELSK